MVTKALGLFEAIGVEIEYMIADRRSLDIKPVADEALRAASGDGVYVSDIEIGPVGWSNELVNHVIEIKTIDPVALLSPMIGRLQENVETINGVLLRQGACLLPTGAHPWMAPKKETILWPHEGREIYDAYDRIFNCRTHGYANLQCVHVNLPFNGAEEFGRLHAAIRVLLPIIPALAASSPILNGVAQRALDARLTVYAGNAVKVPMVTGQVIPEPVFRPDEYHEKILHPLYAAIAPLDPAGILREEWLNARAVIPRFDRSAMEIRVMDTQECVSADLAVSAAVAAAAQALVAERWSSYETQKSWDTQPLKAIYESTVMAAHEAVITDKRYLSIYGIGQAAPMKAGELWRYLLDEIADSAFLEREFHAPLETILRQGALAARILRACGKDRGADSIRRTYERLAECLGTNRMFLAR